jgi:GR25 family glycosyltransferase involved in LPS biosynthesis
MTELKPLPWKLTPGQLACWDSHAKTIKSWADDEGGREIVRKPLLILEDDVNAEEQVDEVFEELEKELPVDWDLVYLGELSPLPPS